MSHTMVQALILCYVKVFCASYVLNPTEVTELNFAMTVFITQERAIM
jgi:hypothetical protein